MHPRRKDDELRSTPVSPPEWNGLPVEPSSLSVSAHGSKTTLKRYRSATTHRRAHHRRTVLTARSEELTAQHIWTRAGGEVGFPTTVARHEPAPQLPSPRSPPSRVSTAGHACNTPLHARPCRPGDPIGSPRKPHGADTAKSTKRLAEWNRRLPFPGTKAPMSTRRSVAGHETNRESFGDGQFTGVSTDESSRYMLGFRPFALPYRKCDQHPSTRDRYSALHLSEMKTVAVLSSFGP